MTTPEVSHGRGGAGNITPDNTQYTEGDIVRQGEVGSHDDGAFSTGRGGAGNIGDEFKPNTKRADADSVPPEATRAAPEGDYHVGRGGAGNEHLVPGATHHKAVDHHHNQNTSPAEPKQHVSLADKLKGKIVGAFKK